MNPKKTPDGQSRPASDVAANGYTEKRARDIQTKVHFSVVNTPPADLGIKLTSKILLIELLTHVNLFRHSSTRVWPSKATLAERLSVTKRTIDPWMKDLERSQLVSIEHSAGRTTNNVYVNINLILELAESHVKAQAIKKAAANHAKSARLTDKPTEPTMQDLHGCGPPTVQNLHPNHCIEEPFKVLNGSNTSVPDLESGLQNEPKAKKPFKDLEKDCWHKEPPRRQPDDHRTGGHMSRADFFARDGLAAIAGGLRQ